VRADPDKRKGPAITDRRVIRLKDGSLMYQLLTILLKSVYRFEIGK
jgi:hypothetical protein